ncbi:hypothetical protein CSC70_09850 [Pseudoxanthomonas kalamensis DSM 18571]|uniref:DUF2147 domain-containing protein n=1 Tax=Pseudoxanthomonas kalamensis TaxID=289483 RepID=UPI001391055E|nr:DUF2147 domain-containing protein [Pseudoxanthomonas kalamensis]KAF1709974.1 hypothetical protein CSC70_09850 [Pseudoxanthomonas kalamensis DSM 18571]
MRNTFLAAALALPLFAAALPALAADAEGRWKTIDDETGQAKSIVEITRAANGSYSGRIVELLRPSKPNPTCDKCKDDRKDKPITGMEIIRGMKKDNATRFSGGTILKPDEGKVYKSKMELIDGGQKLKVSGCIAFICKSQTWLRQ